MKLLGCLIFSFILFQAFSEAFSSAANSTETTSLIKEENNSGNEQKFYHRINCNYACNMRCLRSSRRNLCNRACQSCCFKCQCVPPGTHGNHHLCPCYANLRTHGGRPKCP